MVGGRRGPARRQQHPIDGRASGNDSCGTPSSSAVSQEGKTQGEPAGDAEGRSLVPPARAAAGADGGRVGKRAPVDPATPPSPTCGKLPSRKQEKTWKGNVTRDGSRVPAVAEEGIPAINGASMDSGTVTQPASVDGSMASHDRRKRHRRTSVVEELRRAITWSAVTTGRDRNSRAAETVQTVNSRPDGPKGTVGESPVVACPPVRRPSWRSPRHNASVIVEAASEVESTQEPATDCVAPVPSVKPLVVSPESGGPSAGIAVRKASVACAGRGKLPTKAGRNARKSQAVPSVFKSTSERPFRVPLTIDRGRFSKQRVEPPPESPPAVPVDTRGEHAPASEANGVSAPSGICCGVHYSGCGQTVGEGTGAVGGTGEGEHEAEEEAAVAIRRERLMQVPVGRISLYTRLAEGGLDAAERPFVACVVKHAQSVVSAWVSKFLLP